MPLAGRDQIPLDPGIVEVTTSPAGLSDAEKQGENAKK